MIVERFGGSNTHEFRLIPNRSLSSRARGMFLFVLGTVMVVVAAVSASQGNRYAPAFAVLHLALVAGCFAAVARRLGIEERIALDGDAVVVERLAGGGVQSVRFHPYWVRLETESEPEPRVVLALHGRRCEVGGMLGAAERLELGIRLRHALAACRESGSAGANG